ANDITFGTAITGKFETDSVVIVAPSKKMPAGADKIAAQQLMTSTLPAETKEVTLATGKTATAYIFKAGSEFTTGKAIEVTKNGEKVTTKHPITGKDVPLKVAAKFTVTPLGTDPAVKITYAKGQPVPNAPTDKSWIEPFGALTSKYGHPVLYTYSLILAIVCGTAGLPHILVRFYTNPDGKTAKRTTFWVMILLGCFYVFPPMFGALGRAWVPELYSVAAGAKSTDSVVLILPRIINNYVPVLGDVLSAVTSMGAFAGFMTTFSGLLVSLTGALAHDIYGNMINPKATPTQKMSAFRVSAVLAGSTAMLLGTMVENFDINMMVGWAFAIGAASYFPMLI
ncbi:cation acetate symporter, partial [bacterium]